MHISNLLKAERDFDDAVMVSEVQLTVERRRSVGCGLWCSISPALKFKVSQ
jgi:hypothetical protein